MTSYIWEDSAKEADRIASGGPIDRDKIVAMLRDHAARMQDWSEGWEEAWSDRVTYYKQLTAAKEMLAQVGIAMDVCARACRNEIEAGSVIEFARDSAPFRNIMATVYGLDAVGADLPPRRQRKAKRAA